MRVAANSAISADTIGANNPSMPSAQTNIGVQGTKHKSRYATASLVLALVGIILNPFLIFAIIYGAITLNKIKKIPILKEEARH